jgi:hypothetical protein
VAAIHLRRPTTLQHGVGADGVSIAAQEAFHGRVAVGAALP